MQKKDKYCLDCFLGSGDLDTILLYSKNKIEKRAVIEHKGRYIFGMITAGNNVYNLNIIKKKTIPKNQYCHIVDLLFLILIRMN